MVAKFWAVIPALALASTVAHAADLPSRAAPPVFVPPPIPAFTWTGFYVGATAGVVDQRGNVATSIEPDGHLVRPQNLNAVSSAASGGGNRLGFAGGGEVGYNHQFGSIVVGVEGDAAYTGGGLSRTNNGVLTSANGARTFSVTTSDRANLLATGRGRIGYAVDRALFYATGGVALTDLHLSQAYSDTLFATSGQVSRNALRAGFAVGGGIEYAFSPNWSVKGEYLFSRFDGGGASYLITSNTGGTNLLAVRNSHLDLQVGRVGLNYRFDTTVPVVARY